MLRQSLVAIALVTIATGCSSTEDAAPTDAAIEAAVDTGTGVADTGGAKVDTGTMEAAPLPGCETELPGGFACTAPTKTAGATTCTDAALLDFVEKCVQDDITVPAACADWKAANAACASCVGNWSWDSIPGKVYPDDYKCYWSTFDATCGKQVNCLFSCQETVCAECVDEEASECYESSEKAGGRCWDVAGKDADACFTKFDKELEGCNVNEIYKDAPNLTNLKAQLLKFYRGACRDNGVWTNATSGGDAGTDAGATETSVADAADAG